MPKYRSKETVEAILWDGSPETANSFLGESYGDDWEYLDPNSTAIEFVGPEGMVKAKEGDYLVRDDKGVVFMLTADTLASKYEAI